MNRKIAYGVCGFVLGIFVSTAVGLSAQVVDWSKDRLLKDTTQTVIYDIDADAVAHNQQMKPMSVAVPNGSFPHWTISGRVRPIQLRKSTPDSVYYYYSEDHMEGPFKPEGCVGRAGNLCGEVRPAK